MRVLMAGNAGFFNRGCEAIVRSTITLLPDFIEELQFNISSYHPVTDAKIISHVGSRCSFFSSLTPRYSLGWIMMHCARLMGMKSIATQYIALPVISAVTSSDAVLSVGGDNYCYSSQYHQYAIDKMAKRNGIPLILWGVSIEPSLCNEELRKDLALFDLILARETRTFTALCEMGFKKTTRLVADPAFLLKMEDASSMVNFPTNKRVLGLNASSLARDFCSTGKSGLFVESINALIRHAAIEMGWNVVLIPHVYGPGAEGTDDLQFLSSLEVLQELPSQVSILNTSLNAPQLKSCISKCDIFIGARTHSTIAALSSCVPTITIAYSTKGWGIPSDVYGHEKYIVGVDTVSPEVLIKRFTDIVSEEHYVRKYLMDRIPVIQERARDAAKLLSDLLRSWPSSKVKV